MTIVSDSSPLIVLARIGLLQLLDRLYGDVLIPPAVHQEVIVEGKRLHKPGVEKVEEAQRATWLKTVTLSPRQTALSRNYGSTSGIGKGEAEAIALARSRRLPVILDDRYARELARTAGVTFLGTAAILLEAFFNRLVTRTEFTASLKELGKAMWLSPDIMAELLRLSEEARE